MKRLLLAGAVLWYCTALWAQQLPLFTQYRDQAALLNPAWVQGSYLLNNHLMNIGASYRSQWASLETPIVTGIVRGDYTYLTGGGTNLVFGGHLMYDRTGPISNTGLYGRLAGLFSSDPEYVGLSVGLSAGVAQYRIMTEKIRLREEGDNILGQQVRKIYPDVGLGVYGYRRLEHGWFEDDIVYGGISIPQTIAINIAIDAQSNDLRTKRVQHFYAMMGLYKIISDESFLEPSVWLRYAPNARVSADFNLKYQISGNFWIGAGISTAANAHFETGVMLGEKMGLDANIRLGYGFDYSFNTFGPFVGGTHEISIIYSR